MDDSLPDLAEALEQELRARAMLYGWTAVTNPQLVEAGNASLMTLLAALPHSTPPLPPRPPPRFRRAIELQPSSLNLLVCGLDDADFIHSYTSALWWTGQARVAIPPGKRSDLHLFLIAPTGTRDSPEWHGRRSEIETDERFCRKFVWLPSAAPEPAEIEVLLDRTFLAQPWDANSAQPTALDPLERLVSDEYKGDLLTREEARDWLARLGTIDAGGSPQLAEDLVAILERSS